MKIFRLALPLVFAASTIALVLACGDDDPAPAAAAPDGSASTVDGASARSPEPAGSTCRAASECYAGVDGGADGGLVGVVTCIDKVTNGYCTHTCTQDTDCCSVPGECRTSVKQVCSPFENQPAQYCFLSCEDDDIAKAIAANADAGYYDGGAVDAGTIADSYCRSFAGTSTSCRSSGGGSNNRKVCIPNE
jgi:hypothetical protein